MLSKRLKSPPGGPPRQSITVGSNASLMLVLFASISVVTLVGCGNETAYEKVEPYELTSTDSGINIVVLTPQASDRLRMATAPVTLADSGGDMSAVPYAALIYDTNGGTWVYQQTDSLTYQRVEVAVDHIEGDTVYLTDAPEEGTPVAVTSVAELYGTDTGVGK